MRARSLYKVSHDVNEITTAKKVVALEDIILLAIMCYHGEGQRTSKGNRSENRLRSGACGSA